MVPIVETARLRLRGFRETDLDRWAVVMADPATVRHLGGHPFSREDTWRRLLASSGLWAVFGYGYWAVERLEDGLLVGQVGLADFKREMTPRIDGIPEAGWIFAPDSHGRGYAHEAVSAALAWADDALGPCEMTAIIDPDNHPSIRLAERCRFSIREEAVYKEEPILLFRRPASPTAAAAAASASA